MLHIAGDSPNSRTALHNLKLQARHPSIDLEIVDVIFDSGRALADSVFVTPTMTCMEQTPPLRIIGDLSNEALLLASLRLADLA